MKKIVAMLICFFMAFALAQEAPRERTKQLDRKWLMVKTISDTAYGYDPDPKTFKVITKADEFTFDMLLAYADNTHSWNGTKIVASVLTVQASCKQKKTKVASDVSIDINGYEIAPNEYAKRNNAYVPPPLNSVQLKVIESICNGRWPDEVPKEDKETNRNWI